METTLMSFDIFCAFYLKFATDLHSLLFYAFMPVNSFALQDAFNMYMRMCNHVKRAITYSQLENPCYVQINANRMFEKSTARHALVCRMCWRILYISTRI